MAGTVFFKNTTLTSIDDLITELNAQFLSAGWTTEQTLNANMGGPATAKIRWERMYKINGTVLNPAQAYVTVVRVNATTQGDALMFWGCSAYKAATISTINRTGTTVTVVTTSPHGFVTGNPIIINGTDNEAFHNANTTNSTLQTITVTGATTFTYTDTVTGVAAGLGGTAIVPYNWFGNRSTGSGGNDRLIVLDSAMQVYGVVDEFRTCFITKQGGNTRVGMLGQSGRRHIPADFSDTALTTGPLTAGLGVTVNLDRSSPNLCVGQKVWVIDAFTNLFERTTILTKPSNTQFTCDLANSYSATALVGEDPMPVFVMGGTTATTQNLTAYTARFPWFTTGVRTDAQNVGDGQTMIPVVDTGITVANIDPDAAGYYQGQDVVLQRTTAPVGVRCNINGTQVICFGVDVQSDGDLQRTGCAPTTTDFMIFPSQVVSSTFGLSIGPGAN